MREWTCWLVTDAPLVHAALQERNDEAETVRHVDVTRLLPPKDGRRIQKDDPSSSRVEAAIEEGPAAGLQLVQWIVGVGDDDSDLLGQLDLDFGDHSPE